MKRIHLNLSVVTIALLISLLSLAVLFSLPPSPAKASPSLLPACGTIQHTTKCSTGACVYNPGAGCPGGWVYTCNAKWITYYTNGKKVGANAGTGNWCSYTSNCQSTCQ